MQKALTTTSYAILGHLAMQPWTMYDLAAQMRRNVHYFFPRAESQVYAEPRRLVDMGFATAQTVMTGRRARTVYSISDAGLAELARWLAEPVSKGPLLEFEGLLRVFLSPFGDERILASTLVQIRREIAGMLDQADRVRDEYLAGTAPFQRYAASRSMIHDFLFSFGELIDAWAERSQTRMAEWPTQTPEERGRAGLEAFAANTRGSGQTAGS